MSATAPPGSSPLGAHDDRARQLAAVERLAQVGFFEWTIATDDLHWSDALYRVFGREPGSFTPSYDAWLQAIHPEDRAAVEAAVGRAFETHDAYAVEHRIVRPDGVVRILHGRGNVELDEQGEPVRIVGIAKDVTEARREEHRLRDFVTDVAHELRTPLSAVQSSVDLLRASREDLPQDARDATMNVLSRQLRQLRTLANALLEIDALKPAPEALMLEDVRVEDALSAAVVSTPRPERSLLAVHIEDGLTARGTYEHLERVVSALLANAFEHGGETVELRAARDGYDIRVTVADDGPGVPPDLIDELYVPFSRGRDVATTGAGLGLTLASRLTEALGGRLRYRNRPGGGAEFTVQLEAVDRVGLEP